MPFRKNPAERYALERAGFTDITVAIAGAARYIRAALCYFHGPQRLSLPNLTAESGVMRAEVESIVEEIKRSVGLLRRHL